MAGIKPHIVETLEWMKRHRMMVMDQMDLKIYEATYGELRKSLEAFTHNNQLLEASRRRTSLLRRTFAFGSIS
jgi:hypothetical protein